MNSIRSKRRLVLVGGGHAHIQAFHAFHQSPLADTQLTLVVDRPQAVYSGMVPGYVAGRYRPEELTFELESWVKRLGAELIFGRVTALDGDQKELMLADGKRVPYDVCSLNIGSTVAGLGTPGAREHTLATRPIGDFVASVVARLEAAILARQGASLRLAIVGGGAAGVELAFCLEQRARKLGARGVETRLLFSADAVMQGAPASLRRRVTKELARRGIVAPGNERVVRVEAGSLETDQGQRHAFDLCVWATGAAAHLKRGWLPVGKTLQNIEHPEVFAVGDCAQLTQALKTPKAGVYAVREGPILAHNLRAFLQGGALRDYVPQPEFLSLLNLGNGLALGCKWGLSFRGRWVMALKDRVDRQFMTQFQSPDA